MLYYNKYYDFYDSGIKIQRLKSLMNERRTKENPLWLLSNSFFIKNSAE